MSEESFNQDESPRSSRECTRKMKVINDRRWYPKQKSVTKTEKCVKVSQVYIKEENVQVMTFSSRDIYKINNTMQAH